MIKTSNAMKEAESMLLLGCVATLPPFSILKSTHSSQLLAKIKCLDITKHTARRPNQPVCAAGFNLGTWSVPPGSGCGECRSTTAHLTDITFAKNIAREGGVKGIECAHEKLCSEGVKQSRGHVVIKGIKQEVPSGSVKPHFGSQPLV